MAFQTFYPNCTAPNDLANYVGAPNVRSTLSIVWTSIATIIACNWTALHLDIPKEPGRWNSLSLGLKWAILTLLLPEIAVTKAISDYLTARHFLHELDRTCKRRHGWHLKHMLYVGMGGIVAVLDTRERSNDPFPRIEHRTSTTLKLDDIGPAISSGKLHHTPPISLEELEDKSKSDLFATLLAVSQVLYFLIGIIDRASAGFGTTQLELGAAAFVPYACCIYLFSIRKPKGVGLATTVYFNRGLPRRSPTHASYVFAHLQRLLQWHQSDTPIVWTTTAWELTARHLSLVGLVLLSIPFGAVHMAAWNAHFPSETDLMLWRTASIVIMTALPVWGLAAYCHFIISGEDDQTSWLMTILLAPFIICAVPLFLAARCIIIAEMIRCMLYLPPTAYQTTWSVNFPLFGQ